MSRNDERARAGLWRHVRAVLLLPVVNTIGIPVAILAATQRWDVAWMRTLGPIEVGALALAALSLAAGLALVAHTIALFVRVGCGTLAPWDPTQALVGGGAYRYSRNPMKVGLFLVLLAEALLLRSPPLLAWFGVFAMVNAIYIRVSEEPGLRARFGIAYDEYCARVPRWLPDVAAFRPRDRHGETA